MSFVLFFYLVSNGVVEKYDFPLYNNTVSGLKIGGGEVEK